MIHGRRGGGYSKFMLRKYFIVRKELKDKQWETEWNRYMNDRDLEGEEEVEITFDEIKEVCKLLKGKRVVEKGGVNNKEIKIIARVAGQWLKGIMQACMDKREFPVMWKVAGIM